MAATLFPAPARTADFVGYMTGVGFILSGGIVAAVTGPLALAKGSWVAAYLVLVAGVAQILITNQFHLLGSAPPAAKNAWAALWLWLGGNLLVISGAFVPVPWLTILGGVALWVVLLLALTQTRAAAQPGWAWMLRAWYLIMVVSVPIGLILAYIRN